MASGEREKLANARMIEDLNCETTVKPHMLNMPCFDQSNSNTQTNSQSMAQASQLAQLYASRNEFDITKESPEIDGQ